MTNSQFTKGVKFTFGNETLEVYNTTNEGQTVHCIALKADGSRKKANKHNLQNFSLHSLVNIGLKYGTIKLTK